MSMRISKLVLVLSLLALPAHAAVDDSADILDAESEAKIEAMIADHQKAGGGPVLVRTEKQRIRDVTIPGALPMDYVRALGRADGVLKDSQGLIYVVNTTEKWIMTEKGRALQSPAIGAAFDKAVYETVLPQYNENKIGPGTVEGVGKMLAALPVPPPAKSYYPLLGAFGLLLAVALVRLLQQTGKTWAAPETAEPAPAHHGA